MKRLILTMTALMMAVYAVSAVAIVPQPQSVIEHGRAFVVRPSTVVYLHKQFSIQEI